MSGSQLRYALGLLLCIEALGGSINLGQALILNITVTIFAGVTPVPA